MGDGVMTCAPMTWQDLNQSALEWAFASLRRQLGDGGAEDNGFDSLPPDERPATAIEALTEIFQLTPFERDLLLLCAGLEMDPKLAALCAELHGRTQPGVVTFSLALRILREPHWSALSDSSALRRYRLLRMEPGVGLAAAPLRIEERVLQYLAGINQLDSRLETIVFHKAAPEWMDEEHFRLATETLRGDGQMPHSVLHLCGDDSAGQESVAALVAHRAGRQLYILRHEDTPSAGTETDHFLQLWMRESVLLPAFLLLQWENENPIPAARQLAERLPGAVMVASRDAIRLHRPVESHEVNKPSPVGQQRIWQEALGPAASAIPGVLNEIAEQFRFSAETIAVIAASVSQQEVEPRSDEAPAPDRLGQQLWNACRMYARPRLQGLAERITASATWDDLVLPETQTLVLRQIVSQSRHRMTVNEEWGFAERNRRGLGLSALFAGPSGVGKTLAAEVLANELKLDLYRIDLSSVVSKYIGETEKNLRQVFDAAEVGGVLLLFDEADALFGKRSDVKDSHDRYANIEVGYLLQRMESFQGLAVLTSNLKTSLDKSFQRRLRFTVDFPFPDATQRQAIWKRVFPPSTPTKGLDTARLAMLNMTGGNIRNIALNAAFFAAEQGEPVSMAHVLQAAKLEAVKIERPLAEAETRGWV